MNGEPIIKVRSAAAGYGGRALWSEASFEIPPGEFVAVLGPNGAGKTTIFKIFLGLLPLLDGEVRLFGKAPRRGNGKIGYVPQRHEVSRELGLDVIEIVRLGSCAPSWGFDMPQRAQRERAHSLEALRSVDGEHLAHKRLGDLSGGELQRVLLAQALAGNPELLLLDEPLANLDIRREGELVAVIERAVKERGMTALLIAHNINPLLGALDRVMYVAGGRVAVGKPDDVLNADILSKLYGTQVEVLRDSKGRVAILGAEDFPTHHD